MGTSEQVTPLGRHNKVRALYNEIEPFCVNWLRNLSAAGHVAEGDVDGRSIAEINSADLADRGQCHFFAGIGVWSRALRIAGVPDELPVWTGSCPCQPFSNAGKRGGFSDARHLWPEWIRLIRECRPGLVFGEQVASQDGLGWLDVVLADLEEAGYACAAIDLCAAGVGAPHIRQRLWFVAARLDLGDQDRSLLAGWRERLADADGPRSQGGWGERTEQESGSRSVDGRGTGTSAERLADDDEAGRGKLGARAVHPRSRDANGCGPDDPRAVRLGDAVRDGDRQLARELHSDEESLWPHSTDAPEHASAAGPGYANGFWAPHDWVACADGKARPVEPSTFPLAHGAPSRVGRLRAYGNAIVSEAAAAVIEAGLLAVCDVLHI